MTAHAVYKYPIEIEALLNDRVSILLPVGYHVMSVQPNGPHDINLYVLVDTETTTRVQATFRVAGTGHQITTQPAPIGTVVTPSGLVWHVFEEWN